MKLKAKKLTISIALPLAVGALGSLLAMGGFQKFEALAKPPLTPPGWVFPVVWTVLYVMMGVASYLVLVSNADREDIEAAITVYLCQLSLNLLWPLLFFRFELYLFSFFWLVILWLMILATMAYFAKLSKPAGWLLIPYLCWVIFAGYLNLGVYLLN